MWKNLRLRPILASVLVLAFARETFAVDESTASSATSIYNYAGHMTFTVQGVPEPAEGQPETVIENFPLFLRIEEDVLPVPFHFSMLRNGSDDITFLDSKGQVLSYEIETWEPPLATFWVKVPRLRNGATVTMCWNLRDGCSKPRNDTTAVWSDYVGVWHFGETIGREDAADTLTYDSTGNGYDARPVTYATGAGDLRDQTYSGSGVFGNARHNSYGNQVARGCRFEVDNSELMKLGTNFTFTGWFKSEHIISTSKRDGAVIVSRKTKQNEAGGWYAQMLESSNTDRAMKEIYAQGGGSDFRSVKISDEVMTNLWTFLCLAYDGGKITISGGNKAYHSETGAVTAVTDNDQKISFGNYNGAANSNICSFDGYFDEFRIRLGSVTNIYLELEYEQGTNKNFCAASDLTNDTTVVLQNSWEREPSITKTVWEEHTHPTWDDFDIAPRHGEYTVLFYDRATGAVTNDIPTAPGSYRVVVTVEPSGSKKEGFWGALEYTLGFRISKQEGSHAFNVNVAHILLCNDDYTVEGGEVEWQSYDNEDRYSDVPYWQHLDSEGNDVSTTYDYYWSDSLYFNLGGGTHHIYRYGDGIDRLWDLRDIRIGNTFNNGEFLWERTGRDEEYDEGLSKRQNYLPWNPESQRVLNQRWASGEPVEGYHRFAGHIVMQNTTNAAVTSTCYTNGIGTIYFDAVNGWTDNITNALGEANYRLVVEIATNSKEDATLPPKEEYISSEDAQQGIEIADRAKEPFYKANWVRCDNLRVLNFIGSHCEDLGTTNVVDLKVTEGGNYGCFYRVIVPVNLQPKTGGIRFRIRRVAIDHDQVLYPDGTADGAAYILLDNIICSKPADCVQLMPYGKYFPEKTRKNNDIVQGWEGAFVPAYPSVTDSEVFGRAKATMPDGSTIPKGVLSAATMHYRWHYLEQRTTGWKQADLDLDSDTLVTREPLELPLFQGDIDFWFDAVQHGNYYVYADYSGGTDEQGNPLGLGDSGYTEEVPVVTNQAPTAVQRPDGTRTGDWFVRTREGKSAYSELKLLVKTSEKGAVREEPLSVVKDDLWRGFYHMTNVCENGILWRIEARNHQADNDKSWNWSTNRWYVMDWTDALPTFPASGRMSEGTTNSWSRMPCDMQTGYLMFQVDETSLGVTVIRSDYQAFDKWNDAGNGYFTGSSTEDTDKSGSSSEVREYSQDYKSWVDTPATDTDWQLNFNDGKIGDPAYPGYQTFVGSGVYKQAWRLGKGMWVYNKYREPDSHVALQMAGCGEGFAEFSYMAGAVGDNWPRGLESVSFHSRIAQTVSPAFMSFYEDGVRLTNYTFMARTCFDMKENCGFAGSASVSLFAYYRADKGAYEARWEQIEGDKTSNPSYPNEIMAPKKTGQRLVISRWDPAGNGTYQVTELIAATNSVVADTKGNKLWNFPMPVMPAVDGETATNNLLPFCISAYQTKKGGPTYITAAVRVKAPGTYTGVTSGEPIPDNDARWFFVTYKDTSSDRKQSGSYGVLASNCEGMFLRPQFKAQPSWPGSVTNSESVVAKNNYSATTVATATPKLAYAECYDDIVDGWWAIDAGRMKAFGDSVEDYNYGFTYVKPHQTIDVYVSPKDKENWSLLRSIPVDGFGQPGPDPDLKPMFYYTSDSLVRLKTGGGYDDYRTDVVINDIEIRQWRGYKSKEASSYTNFVFTSGWITNGAVQLSAKRTKTDEPCSIRSPWMDGKSVRGIGLGSFRFTYREPQKNIHLLVQIATNVVEADQVDSRTMDIAEGDGNNSWHTITNLYYSDLWPSAPKQGDTRTWSQSFGYHGAKGLMRVIVDPKLVEDVSPLSWTNTAVFGAIDITAVKCFDEPALSRACWWGWNLQTIGDQDDSQKRMYLPDGTWDLDYGQSLALNNSVTADVDPAEEVVKFRQHMPFLQSPTFTNAVIGQISFKARKYELSDYAPAAKVVVYGASRNPNELSRDDQWTYIAEFQITNTIYTTYTCKTDAQNFYALRLGVVGVDGTQYQPAETDPNPQRVLLDEVSISEAVRAMLSFRNVGAFRSYLDKNVYVEGVTTSKEQPLCDENWGVQAEVFATMLGDEIDKTFTPRVKLHWYVGKEPWGFANWRSIKEKTTGKGGKVIRDSAWLAQTDGSNYVYRSSYDAAPAAIMDAQSDPGTVVQYMLEVEYRTINSTTPGEKPSKALVTNWLDSVSWKVPEWYAPVDYNTDPGYGAGKTFAAFNILDTVAPGWAWLNEANVFGTKSVTGANSDEQFQYVEVCVPMEADLSGWRLRMLEAGIYNDTVVTNWIATFGKSATGWAPGTKKYPAKYNKTFRCLGNKESSQLKKENGTLDGIWQFSQLTSTFRNRNGVDCVYNVEMPFGVQLVRPSGVIESSIVVVGTNRWGRLPGSSEFDPTNIVAKLNRNVPGSKFFYAAEDCCGTFRSASVTDGGGESATVWTNNWACSPGYINTNVGGKVEQKIDPDHPTPHGDSIIVYASVDLSGGPIRQWVGGPGSVQTNTTEMVILKRGSARGTNIVYQVDPWYELAGVTTNGAAFWPYRERVRYTNIVVGVGASNNLTVVARAKVDSDLSGKYGLTPDNPFTPAVMDWLRGGKDAYGNPFVHNGEIALAEYWNMDNTVETNLTLTQMYCLDMDPTVSNLIYKAGMFGAPSPVEPPTGEETSLTNVRMSVFMMISNTVESVHGKRAWPPYILRGLDPNFTSWDYKNGGVIAQSWTSETFKITGILANDEKAGNSYEQGGIALRWFVFHTNSFYQVGNPEGHEPFTTDIEIIDPHASSSPGAAADWDEYVGTPIWYFWAIDMRLKPVGPEILKPENYYLAPVSQ